MRILFGMIILAVMIALAFCSWAARRSGKEAGKAASNLTASLILPLAGNGIIIMSPYRLLSTAGCYMYYLGLDVSIAALIHFTLVYCQITWPRVRYRNLVYSLLTVDVVQLLLNPVFGHAFAIEPIEVDGFAYYRMIPFLGQRFHRVVDYLLLGMVIAIFIIRMVRTPRLLQERYSVILGTLVLVSLWETAYIFSGTPIDRSMIGFGVFGLLIFYFSLYYRPMRLLDRALSGIVSERMQPMYIFDDRQECIWMNRMGREFLGLGEDERDKVGNALAAMFGDRHPGEEEWMDPVTLEVNGETRYLELAKVPQRDRASRMNGCFYIYIRDLTGERRGMERKLYNARHDRLTGLFNRDYLYERTRELLAEHPEEAYLAIQAEICDLKLINDLYGNSFGDFALRNTAQMILGSLPEHSVCGRLGGDSFGVCMPEKYFDRFRAEKKLSTFVVEEEGTRYHVLIHVGVYRVTDRSVETSSMYDRALMAMEEIADDYRTHIAWYDPAIREQVIRNRQLSDELPGAIEEGQIRPWLQPIVDRDGSIIGAEALARWDHPTEGILQPGSFVPVFERNGMIADLDRCIWRNACKILSRWKKEGKDMFISVNISPKDFYLIDVAEELKSLVREYGISPERLRLEITETVMMNDREKRMAILRDLQTAGFLIEMDDFGSGYSSLNLLREMPVDILKIDMVFIRKTSNNERAQTIVRQVISLARELDIASLIEGVETENQYDRLMEMGCQLYQGFYFAAPMPEEAFEKASGDSRRDDVIPIRARA